MFGEQFSGHRRFQCVVLLVESSALAHPQPERAGGADRQNEKTTEGRVFKRRPNVPIQGTPIMTILCSMQNLEESVLLSKPNTSTEEKQRRHAQYVPGIKQRGSHPAIFQIYM